MDDPKYTDKNITWLPNYGKYSIGIEERGGMYRAHATNGIKNIETTTTKTITEALDILFSWLPSEKFQ